MKKFFGGFQRVTETKIPDKLRTDVYMFVNEVLVKEGYVTTKKREKFQFDDVGLPCRYSTEGHIGMKVISDPSDAIVDLIFVHGLTGNRKKTWTHRNETFWPRDLLREDFPRARIMTFGYDADVVRFWTIASSNRLQDHGKSLAWAVLDQREQLGPRPIVFIAHSLGGLKRYYPPPKRIDREVVRRKIEREKQKVRMKRKLKTEGQCWSHRGESPLYSKVWPCL